MILWREIQKQNFTSWKTLAQFLDLSSIQTEQIIQTHPFSLNVPRRLAEKMEKRTLEDPLLRQFVPLHSSISSPEHFQKDPVKDQTFCRSPKLLQKYKGRVLLLCSSACAMHCRFCFRQNFPYETERKGFEEELRMIRDDPTIKEVILSGGDPLSLNNEALQCLLEELNTIPHLTRLRFHTRFPIGIPERLDSSFLSLIEKTRLQVWFVIHCNHPKELDQDIFSSLRSLQYLRVPILTHTVLLKGVNDSVLVLKSLFELLVDHGMHPYYLNQLDPVEGSHHFEVPQEKGRRLMQELRNELPGYAMPSYAQEIPGKGSKTLIKIF